MKKLVTNLVNELVLILMNKLVSNLVNKLMATLLKEFVMKLRVPKLAPPPPQPPL